MPLDLNRSPDASGMSPSPPPSPGSRTPPPLRSTEEQPPLPFALLPPKKRWLWLWQTTSEATASPSGQLQIHATPPAADSAAATNALATPALLLPAAAGQKRSSPLPPLIGDLHEPNAPAAAVAADGKPWTPPPCKRGRKVVRRVRKVVRKIVPKGKKTSFAAARKETIIAAEAAAASAGGGGGGGGGVGASLLPAVADEEPEPGEFVPDKTFADCNNADAACQPLLGEEEAAAGEEAAAIVAGEPEAAEEKLVSSKQGDEERVVTVRQNRMREVFVGGLHMDATEEDVRAALAEAGEITEVRMIMDAETTKNKGYCFVRYSEPAQARKAIEELGNVKICGKPCRIQALGGNNGKAKSAHRDRYEDYIYNPRSRNESNAYAMETLSYGAVPHAIDGYSPLYHHGNTVYLPDSNFYGLAEPWGGIRMRQSGSRRPGQPHGSRR